MKKIAIFTRGLLPNGATISLIELIKRLPYDKIELDLYILNKKEVYSFYLEQIPSAVNIKYVDRYEVNKRTINNVLIYPIHFFKACYAGKMLKKYSELSLAEYFKFAAARYPKVNIVYDAAISYRHYDIDVFFVANNINAKKKAFLVHGVQPISEKDKSILTPIYKKYDKIFPVSYTAKNNIDTNFEWIKNKSVVMYSIVDSEMILREAKIGKSLPISNKIKLLTIGRLSQEKGMDLVVEACIILKKRRLNFIWYICGDGPMKDELIFKIEENNLQSYLVLLGHQDNPYGYLKSCDIYIQPSHLESYCLSINEAKIFHKPIISTNIPAAIEQLKNYETGLLCTENQIDMSNKIQELVESPELRHILSSNLETGNYSHYEAVSQFTEFVLQ